MSNPIFSKLKPYLDIPNPDFAYIVNGKWGSGKTYFLNNELKPLFRETVDNDLRGIKLLYASANGVKDYNELINSLRWQKLGMSKNGIIGSIASSMISVIPHDGISNSLQRLSESTGEIFDSVIKFDRSHVVIIDDLERVDKDCDLIGLLGKINSDFVEHNNIKTILVCDEEELLRRFGHKTEPLEEGAKGNTNPTTPKEVYKRSLQGSIQDYRNIKEKVVRRTLLFLPELENVVPKIIEKCVASKNFISHFGSEENIQLLISWIEKNKIQNLRKVKFFLDHAEEIVDVVYEHDQKDPLNSVLQTLFHVCIDSFKTKDKKRNEFIFKFSHGLESITSFVNTGYLDKELLLKEYTVLKKDLLSYTNEKRILNEFCSLRIDREIFLSDSQFEDVLAQTIASVQEGKYNLEDLLRFTEVMAWYIENKVICRYTHSEIAKISSKAIAKSKLNPYSPYNSSIRKPESILKKVESSEYTIFKNDFVTVMNEKRKEYYGGLYEIDLQNLLNSKEFPSDNTIDALFLNMPYTNLKPIAQLYIEDNAFKERFNKEMERLSFFNSNEMAIDNLKKFRSDIEKELCKKEGPSKFLFAKFEEQYEKIINNVPTKM